MPLLVGEPMWRCPEALAHNVDVQALRGVLPSPWGGVRVPAGELLRFPPRVARMFEHAEALKKEYDAEHSEREQ